MSDYPTKRGCGVIFWAIALIAIWGGGIALMLSRDQTLIFWSVLAGVAALDAYLFTRARAGNKWAVAGILASPIAFVAYLAMFTNCSGGR